MVDLSRFNRWLNYFSPEVRDCFAAVSSMIGLKWVENKVLVSMNITMEQLILSCPSTVSRDTWISFLLTSVLSPRTRETLARTGTYPDGDVVDHLRLWRAWVLGGFFAEGPRLYAPGADIFKGLAATKVNIPVTEYYQPFETLAVVIPPSLYPNGVTARAGRPAVIIGRYFRKADGGFLLASVTTTDEPTKTCDTISRVVMSPTSERVNIEDWFDCKLTSEGLGETGLTDATLLNQSESEAVDSLRRVFFNTCALMVNYGYKKEYEVNPEYAARLRASLTKKNLPDSVRRANERALRQHPVVYEFSREVMLYERPGTSGGSHKESQGLVGPHPRLACWARQPHGPHSSERKWIVRAGSYINRHLMQGPLWAGKSTYTGPSETTPPTE